MEFGIFCLLNSQNRIVLLLQIFMEPGKHKTRGKRGPLLQFGGRITTQSQHQSIPSAIGLDTKVDNQRQERKLEEIKKMKLGEDWALQSLPHDQNALLHHNLLPSVTTLKSEAELLSNGTGLCQHSVEVDRGDNAREEASKILLQQGIADGVEVSLTIPSCQTESLDRSVTSQNQSAHRTAESLSQRNSNAILNHCKTKMKRGREPEMLQLREESKNDNRERSKELKITGDCQNALSNCENLQFTTAEIMKGLQLNNREQQCKAVFKLVYGEDCRGIEKVFNRPGLKIFFVGGTTVFIGSFDPLVLWEELKDFCSRVDPLTCSVLSLNTYAGLDGRHSYSTRKRYEKVLENLRVHNAILEYAIERVRCGIGGEQTVPHESEKERSDISKLPRECIEHIISFTSPMDACSLSIVCRAFRDVAESNAVWERFMPSEGSYIISRSSAFDALIFPSAKLKYLYLCHYPVFLGDGSMCFTLEKRTGKLCFMIAPTMQSILKGDSDYFWEWKRLKEASFSRVPCLKFGAALGFIGLIDTRLLSPETTYVAYLVYKLAYCSDGFETSPVELFICLEGDLPREIRLVLLDPPEDMPEGPQERQDGWKEIMMGEYFNGHGEDRYLCSCLRRDLRNSGMQFEGIIINCIELRPKGFLVT